MWIPIPIAIVIYGIIIWYMGKRGMERTDDERPRKFEYPDVSVIIPAYKSEATIERCLKSVREIDYPKRLEIIVVNDSKDRVPEICRAMKVKCIQNTKRIGKPGALNKGIRVCKGKVLLLVDSDTFVSKDILRKTIPWFADTKVGAVMPEYTAANRKGVARLVEIENRIMLALVKAGLVFGNMMGFRGCCVAVKKDVVERLGGFRSTLTEDNDMSARMVKAGYKIRMAKTRVRTSEPETWKELRKQKFRWGKGSLFCFLRYYRTYLASPEFALHFFPYLALGGVFFLWFVWNIVMTISGYMNGVWLFAGIASALAASVAHVYIISGRRDVKLSDVVGFVVFYMPGVAFFYFKGLLSGIKAKKNRERELDVREWD